jgi:hypothetical protein
MTTISLEIPQTDVVFNTDIIGQYLKTASHIIVDCKNETKFKSRLSDVFDETFPWVSGQTYLAGGSLNLILDTSINYKLPIFKYSDYDIFITQPYGQVCLHPEFIVKDILKYLVTKFKQVELAFIGSVLSVKLPNQREVQLIILDKVYKNWRDILKGFDFEHLKLAYNGNNLIYTSKAYNAIKTKTVTCDSVKSRSQNLRLFKTISRGYKISGKSVDIANIISDKEIVDYLVGNDKYSHNRTLLINHEDIIKYLKNNNFNYTGLNTTNYGGKLDYGKISHIIINKNSELKNLKSIITKFNNYYHFSTVFTLQNVQVLTNVKATKFNRIVCKLDAHVGTLLSSYSLMLSTYDNSKLNLTDKYPFVALDTVEIKCKDSETWKKIIENPEQYTNIDVSIGRSYNGKIHIKLC